MLPKLLQPLLDAKLYAETIAFARNAIEIRPQTPQFVAEENAIVESLMAQGLYDQALAAAKSYYNVATLKDTAAAIDLVADVLNKSRGGRDPTIGLRFKTEQASTGPQSPLPAAGSVDPALQADVPSSTNPSLDAITVDDSAYEPAIARTFTHAEESYGSLIGRGNLLLLADRPVEARQCFTSACRFTDGETGKLRNALEGIARAVRAKSGGITEANALITAIQQGDISSLPKDLTAPVRAGCKRRRKGSRSRHFRQPFNRLPLRSKGRATSMVRIPPIRAFWFPLDSSVVRHSMLNRILLHILS